MTRISVFFLLVLGPVLAVLLAILGILTFRNNLLGYFLLFLGVLYPLGLLLINLKHKNKYWISPPSEKIEKEESGDRSFWAISFGMIAAFYIPPLEFLYFGIKLTHTLWVQVVGFCILLFGAVLFIRVRRALGTSYSGHISTVEEQPLVQHGPYRLIRHPGYAAYLLIALGISVGYMSLTGLLSIGLLLIPGLVYRIIVEERVLVSHFGEQYKQYQRQTKRLIPRVW